MQRNTKLIALLGSALFGLLTLGAVTAGAIIPIEMATISDYYHQLIGDVTGDWGDYAQLFTMIQANQYFMLATLAIVIGVPVVFALHYFIVGPKHFDHDGDKVLFFPFFARIVHLLGAISFSALAITGILIICGSLLGGGFFIELARWVHIAGAILALPAVVFMLIIWAKDMLPALCDIKWILIAGGYLSKKKVPVPAKKYNAGQKMWFWCGVPGGLLMLLTGFIIWDLGATLGVSVELVVLSTIVHIVLGLVIVAFFMTHVYMTSFAIAGAYESIKTGYKPMDEVKILHSLYKYKESDVVPGGHH